MNLLALGYVVGLGAGLGLVSAQWAVAHRPALGIVRIGAWTAAPRTGARDIDPYARAHLARGLRLPLGAGEGIAFLAERDEAGRALDGRCRYRLTGTMPPSRGWSLTPVLDDGRPLPPVLGRGVLTDAEIVRAEAGEFAITVSALPSAGNWLPLGAGGGFALALRLYDTPVSGQASELRPETLPRVTRIDCP